MGDFLLFFFVETLIFLVLVVNYIYMYMFFIEEIREIYVFSDNLYVGIFSWY